MKNRSTSIPVKPLLIAAGLLLYGLGAGSQVDASGYSRPAFQVADTQELVQFFERNRRRGTDIIPLRNDPAERQLRQRNFRRQDRDRRNSEGQDQDDASRAVRRGDILPLDGIIRSAQNYCPGKFLGAQLQRGGNGYTYRVRILRPSGQRVGLTVDAQTGEVVGGRCR